MTTTLKMSTAPHIHTASGQCNSTSCNSPHRLWRTLQTIIQTDAKDEFLRLCKRTPTDIIVRVLLTSRIANDPALYSPSQKSRVVQFPRQVRPEAVRKFGKSATDLNAVQLALIDVDKNNNNNNNGQMAILILNFLREHATSMECHQFVNHIWGQGNTTLHLACFWNMSRLVRLLLDMDNNGASMLNRKNARLITPRDCCSSSSVLALLTPPKRATRASVPIVTTTPIATTKPAIDVCTTTTTLPSPPPTPTGTTSRPSMLLKKATEKRGFLAYGSTPSPTIVAAVQTEYFQQQQKPVTPPPNPTSETKFVPMTFSSSTSSSSSFSSMSSAEGKDDHCWTPPPSPIARHPWSPAPSPISTSIEEVQLPEIRPSCFPANPIKQPVVKQVRFDPHVTLIDACIRGDLQELKHYCDNQGQIPSVGGIRNRSLLQVALMRGHEHMVSYLADHVDVNHQDSDGWTALHYAAALGLWRSLEYLATLPEVNLNVKAHDGLMIHECVDTQFAQRKCRSIIDRCRRSVSQKA
ncbi:hypothetical protein K492DRAFT_174272 [Lichtheimia hyalospora FSU 10163]|nr:hypothetical protein K492DRAFT_174272 [Lichtheimia hyalospora FSU 10163]